MITHAWLRENLSYSIITGQFFWLKKGLSRVLSKEIGTLAADGYRVIKVNRKAYKTHRLAWFWVTGEFPENDVDHKNGIRDANYWLNLREATRSQNCCNRAMHSNNTSGYKGVSWDKKAQKWQAHIRLNKKRNSLGYHDTAELAYAARLKAEKELHKDFARQLA